MRAADLDAELLDALARIFAERALERLLRETDSEPEQDTAKDATTRDDR